MPLAACGRGASATQDPQRRDLGTSAVGILRQRRILRRRKIEILRRERWSSPLTCAFVIGIVRRRTICGLTRLKAGGPAGAPGQAAGARRVAPDDVARYREQIAELKAREEGGEGDGWEPGGYSWHNPGR